MHESEFIVYHFVCVCVFVCLYICDIWRERDVLGEWEYTAKYQA